MAAVASASTPLPEQIADALPAMICYVGQDARYRFINKAYEEWFGLDRTQIVGRTVEEVVSAAAFMELGPHMRAALAGETRRFQMLVTNRGAAPRRVEATYIPDRAENGAVRGYYGMILDRTHSDTQKRIEEMIDVFEDGFLALDFDWRITYCNRAGAAYSEQARERILGRVYWEVSPEILGGPVEALARRVMAERIAGQLEVASVIHQDVVVLLRAFPIETGIGVSFRDVTLARATANQMRQDRELLADLDRRRTFLLSLTDALHALDDPDAIMSQAAARLGRFLGADRAGYGEMDPGSDMIPTYGAWAKDESASHPTGPRDLRAFGPYVVQTLRSGEILRLNDLAIDARVADYRDHYQRIDARSLLAAPRMRQGRLNAFLYIHGREPRAWTDEDAALVQDVAERTWTALDRARSERAVRESEARFRAMADSAPAPVWVTSAEGPIEFVNQPFAVLAGKPAHELLGDVWLELLHPDDLPLVGAQRAIARKDNAAYTFEARFRVAGGHWRWMRAASKPRFNDSGVFQGYVGMAVDVTDSRAADERQRLLINELNHRVKNTLATVQSLAHQTLREGVNTREARDRFTERLLALSAAHNVLTRENWEGAEVGEIVADAARPYDDGSRGRIGIEGARVRVAPNVALALSMALHELATNAVKYGALSTPEGQISVTWASLPGGEAAELTWREFDGPPVKPPERAGFGSRLLRQGLAAELGAPAVMEYAPTGVVCRLRVPIAAEN